MHNLDQIAAELRELAGRIDDLVGTAQATEQPAKPPAGTNTATIAQIAGELRGLGKKIGNLAGDASAHGAALDLTPKYQSYDEWARHFSIVRQTVVPFGITTAIAIIGWGWGRDEALISNRIPLFPALGLVVWLATAVLMLGLSDYTYYWGRKMKQVAYKMQLTPDDENSRTTRAFLGIGRVAIIDKQDRPIEPPFGKRLLCLVDWPMVAFVIASLGVLVTYAVHPDTWPNLSWLTPCETSGPATQPCN